MYDPPFTVGLDAVTVYSGKFLFMVLVFLSYVLFFVSIGVVSLGVVLVLFLLSFVDFLLFF